MAATAAARPTEIQETLLFRNIYPDISGRFGLCKLG
jgi:hypothetical protein